MSMQKQIFENFMKKYNNPSLKEIAAMTGIQVTRVFRILNGQDMKISEYEKLKLKLAGQMNERSELLNMAEECSKYLNAKNLQDVHEYLGRKLLLSSFKYC